MTLTDMELKEKAKSIRKEKFKKRMLGSADRRGLLMTVVVYVLLITIAFIFMYPVLYMFFRSLMTCNHIVDACAQWLPAKLTA